MAESKGVNMTVIVLVVVVIILSLAGIYFFMRKDSNEGNPPVILGNLPPLPDDATPAEKATRAALDSAALFKEKNARTSQNMLNALPEKKRKRINALQDEYKKIAGYEISDKEKNRKYITIQNELKTLGKKIDVNTYKISNL